MEKRTRTWRWIVVPLLIAIIILAAWEISNMFFRIGYWGNCRYYPAEFTYTERRTFNTPEEGAALLVAETFNYTQIPANTNDDWYSEFITQARRDTLNTTASEFNPYTNCGYKRYNYTAHATWFSNLSITTEGWERYPEINPLQITTNTSTLFPSNIPDWPLYRWLGGYWNSTNYVEFTTQRSATYTNIYLIEMRLTYSYYCGLLCAGETLECQHVIVDASGQVLFATWILFMGPVA
ncbi:MAG: hypothetical protein ACFFD8_10125 [Candidatus Thorarchaeota archaeon]